jgi:hypothetical protein
LIHRSSRDEPVRVFHHRVRERLDELARIEEQRRLWLSTGEDGAEVSTPVECCCTLFDSSGLGCALDRGENPYPPAIMEKFRKLDQLLKSVDMDQDDEDVMNSPAMVPVRSLAAEILRELPPAPTG